MTEKIFWAGIVAPFLGINLLVFLVRDIRQGEIESTIFPKLMSLAGFRVVKRAEEPGKFWPIVALNILAILVLLVVSPLWAFSA
jgi:hypothetical protein